MAKGRVRLGSKNFFTLVFLSVSVLSLMFVTYASQQRTSTQSDASFASAPKKDIEVEIRYDSDGNENYETSDKCVPSDRFNLGLKNTKKQNEYDPHKEFSYNFQPNNNCVMTLPLINDYYYNYQSYAPKYTEHNYTIRLRNDDQLSYTYVIYAGNANTKTKLTGAPRSWTVDAGPNKFVKVVFGIKDSNPAAAAPKAPAQNDTNCDNWSWTYRGSNGAAKSVEYSLALNNKCNKDQRFKVKVDILTSDNKQVTGWTYRFANGDLNSPITKTVDGNNSSGTKVTVSRANAKVAKGSSTYKVRVIATPCKNNNCNNLDTGNRVTYTTSYNVDN